jgi:hypothetical protein
MNEKFKCSSEEGKEDLMKNKKNTFSQNAGDKMERIGEKISDLGGTKIGKKIRDAGDKLEHKNDKVNIKPDKKQAP